jgi:membrane protease YdiL (CAAX protease family)
MVIWHIPNDLLQYQQGGYLMIRIVLYAFITILFTWIYNRTNGSILAVVIFHASMNSMNPLMGIFPITTAGNVILIGFAILVIVWDRMWRRLPNDHPAVYQEATPSSPA